MRKRLLQIGIMGLTAAVGMQMMAKPAKQGLRTVYNADGSSVTVRLIGDEFFHQYMTEDGYPLMEKDGSFYYCDYAADGTLQETSILASDISVRPAAARNYLQTVDKTSLESRIQSRASKSKRRASLLAPGSESGARHNQARLAGSDLEGPPYEQGYGLFPDERFPAYGDQKAIVILVEYTDVKFKTTYQGAENAFDYFNRMLNEENFSAYGATGSAAQYFRENSGGHFRPEFDVFGPITLSQKQSYYGGNDWYGDDQHPADMVKEACEQLDATVNFQDYDRNNDGIVDNVFIFYAGMGEASGGSSNTVWPHSWNMVSAGYPNLVFDGVRVHTYGCSNEWESGRPDGVGTFVHEFSHVMGLPDLYATSYTSSFTPGSWSALDYGPYNNDGMTPPYYGAFERYALGWVKPYEVTKPVSATLRPVSDNVCGVIRSSKDTEFFLLENRQQNGWDAYVPGHGMLVWHVDYNTSVWRSNKVNNTPSHQYVDIEEADGSQSEYSRDGDAFPGVGNKREFTSSTSPAMKTWGGTAVNYPITDIYENNGLVTFNILGGSDEPLAPTQALEATEVTPISFKACWLPVEGCDALLTVRHNGLPIEGFNAKNVGEGSEYVVPVPESNTEYEYTVAMTNGWETSAESAPVSVISGKMTLDWYPVEAMAATEVGSDTFTANWNPLEDCTSYMVTVYNKELGEPVLDTNDFTDGVSNLQGGWMSTSKSSYSMAAYSGEAIPSLRLGHGDYLKTPEYDEVNYVSFWCRGNGSSQNDVINVYANTDEGETLVQSEPVVSDKGGKIVEVKDFPEGTKSVRIEYQRSGANGSLALDDVSVCYAYDWCPVVLDSFNRINVGNVTSYKVTDLKPVTDYFYTIAGTDGDLVSKDSKEIKVSTTQGSSVNSVSEAFKLSVSGLTLTATSSEEILVADYTGALVARGSHKVTLPRAGLYIVTVPAQGYAKKLVLK